MKKTPRIYPEKNPENNKKPQTYKLFKKSQNQTWNTHYLHIKIKVVFIIASYF